MKIFSHSLPEKQHAFLTKRHGINKADIHYLKLKQFSKISNLTKRSLIYLADSFNCNIEDLIFLNQSHSSKCVTIKSFKKIHGECYPSVFDGDAIVSKVHGKVLCVITADCAPILLYDGKMEISGAIHSGWRGAFEGIVESTIRSFEEFGSERSDIKAVLGPTISQEMYEVKDDFLSLFIKDNPKNSEFFNFREKITFDLRKFVLKKMSDLGVSFISHLDHCTLLDAENFFSHRRSTIQGKIETKRQISAIKV